MTFHIVISNLNSEKIGRWFIFPIQNYFFRMAIKFHTLGTARHLAVHKATSTGGQKCAELPFCFSVRKMSVIIESNFPWVDKRVGLGREI